MEDYNVHTSDSSSTGLSTIIPNGEKLPGGGTMTHEVADKFFAIRDGNLVSAFEDIQSNHFNRDTDGELLGKWLLTEISYWNRDKERIVLLGSRGLLICKYDFVARKVVGVQRVKLQGITDLQMGEFQYPSKSIVVPRLYKGMRVSWGSMLEKTFFQKWNPLNTDIPFTTFTSHPVFSVADEESQQMYDIQVFNTALKEALSDRPGVHITDNDPILIETYVGLPSFIHNQSRLGFSRERGGISF